jgi:phosphoribosyl 1,2-cyclic phosphate phosphodiesterase
LLIDTSPDMREQLLAAQVIEIDAVLWTHDHADHCHGLDDVRQIMHHRGAPVPGYARRETLDLLNRRFPYAFYGHDGYPAVFAGYPLADTLNIGDIRISCVDQPHGTIFSTGFRFEVMGVSIAYATDFHAVTPAMIDLYAGVDVWVVDALRERPHPTHAHLALTLEAIEAVRPTRAILTHMDQSMDYIPLCHRLPTGVEPGYDGMTIDLS